MHLTRHTDYSLRVLIYLALRPDKLSNVASIAGSFNVSRNHLVKVVHNLSRLGYIKSIRGHGGGIQLCADPDRVTVGEIVRQTEQSLEVINCQQPECPILPACKLKGALGQATNAFLDVLDDYTLADLVRQKNRLGKLIA
ncbi:MAG: Rrf2 family transcriptional regulator [Gammaproteobacteria bacterium]|nr:Rrf2 family transcriptional regulator [Gammaproteobacteria bacterium]